MQINSGQCGLRLVHSDEGPVSNSKLRSLFIRLGVFDMRDFAKRHLDIRPALPSLTFVALAIGAVVLISYHPDLVGDLVAMKLLRLGLMLAGLWQFLVAGCYSLSVPLLGIAGTYAGLEALKAGIEVPVDPHAFQFVIITSCLVFIYRIYMGII